MRTFKILWVGLRPSAKNTDPNIPFVGTLSGKRLQDWILKLEIFPFKLEHEFLNIYKEILKPKPEDIIDYHPGTPWFQKKEAVNVELYKLVSEGKIHEFDLVIGLGVDVARALHRFGVENFIRFPHPSPRNRLLNDSGFEQLKLKELTSRIREIDRIKRGITCS